MECGLGLGLWVWPAEGWYGFGIGGPPRKASPTRAGEEPKTHTQVRRVGHPNRKEKRRKRKENRSEEDREGEGLEGVAAATAETAASEAASAGEAGAAGTAGSGSEDRACLSGHEIQVVDEEIRVEAGAVAALVPLRRLRVDVLEALLQFFSTPRAMAKGRNFSNISGVLIMRLKRSAST